LTDAQWEIVEPMLPLIKSPGRIPKHPRRAFVDAILHVVRSACSWRQQPVDFRPWQTVYWQFQRWEKHQATDGILQELREQVRITEGREPEPSAGIIDSQSVKAADAVDTHPHPSRTGEPQFKIDPSTGRSQSDSGPDAAR
jgi:transposase